MTETDCHTGAVVLATLTSFPKYSPVRHGAALFTVRQVVMRGVIMLFPRFIPFFIVAMRCPD